MATLTTGFAGSFVTLLALRVAPGFHGIRCGVAATPQSVGRVARTFCLDYGYCFVISWLPFYLIKSRGFSMGSMVAIASWFDRLGADVAEDRADSVEAGRKRGRDGLIASPTFTLRIP